MARAPSLHPLPPQLLFMLKYKKSGKQSLKTFSRYILALARISTVLFDFVLFSFSPPHRSNHQSCNGRCRSFCEGRCHCLECGSLLVRRGRSVFGVCDFGDFGS